MKFNRNKAIIGFLKANEGQKFTSREIAAWLGSVDKNYS